MNAGELDTAVAAARAAVEGASDPAAALQRLRQHVEREHSAAASPEQTPEEKNQKAVHAKSARRHVRG